MPDITITCRRSPIVSEPDEHWQSWSDFKPVDGGKCENYWPFGHRKEE